MPKDFLKMIPLSEPKITSVDIKLVLNQLKSNFFLPRKINKVFSKKLATGFKDFSTIF